MLNIEAEVKEMKQRIIEISKKLDQLLSERESASMMRLTEESLTRFFEEEPDIYKIEDLKVNYR